MMKKLAYFILLDEFADWEGAYLSLFLRELEAWEMKTVSVKPFVKSIGGLTVKVDLVLNQELALADLLVLIGGNSWAAFENKDFEKMVTKYFEEELPIAAICGAVDYLAKKGFLNTHQHTGNNDNSEGLKRFEQYNNAGKFFPQQVVRDQNLVTANGTAALDFAQEVLEMIGGASDYILSGIQVHRLGYYDYLAQLDREQEENQTPLKVDKDTLLKRAIDREARFTDEVEEGPDSYDFWE